MVDGIIIGWVVGLLCGMFLMVWVMHKDFDKAWDESYELGFKHGEELEKLRQAIERKKKLMSEPPEVKKDASV